MAGTSMISNQKIGTSVSTFDCGYMMKYAPITPAMAPLAPIVGSTEPEFTAWLRQILATCLTHLVRRYYGTAARDIRLEQPLADGLDGSSQAVDGGLVAQQSSPSQYASRREEAVRLADALEVLPADYREVIVLRHLEGLTFPAVAERMGRTVDSVEKLWVRAVARLRQAVGGGR